jgi:hypothetical protein
LLHETAGQTAAAISAYERVLEQRPGFRAATERLRALEVQGAALPDPKSGS